MSILIEACCASVDDVLEAEKGGADRVELCSAMCLGGLTPSIGMIKAIKEQSEIPIMAMNRPRSGGFCYTDNEFKMMIEDAKALVNSGVEGIVFGILRKDGTIDSERCKELIRVISHESFNLPKRVQIVFHRAIDVTPNWKAAVEELIEIGFDRILTSGQNPNANDASDTIKQMTDLADNRIEIMPGSGVRKETAKDLVIKTGAKQIHLRNVKQVSDTSCTNGNTSIPFNGNPEPEDKFSMTDASYFNELSKNLN